MNSDNNNPLGLGNSQEPMEEVAQQEGAENEGMSDPILDNLIKNEKKRAMTESITIKVTPDELEILNKKAEVSGLKIGDIFRASASKTAFFENTFETKKSSKSKPKITKRLSK